MCTHALRDGTRLRTVPGLYSWLQPDTIVHEAIGARSYLFIANEGDSKSESLSVKDLTAAALDPEVFPNATALVAVRASAGVLGGGGQGSCRG